MQSQDLLYVSSIPPEIRAFESRHNEPDLVQAVN